MVKIKSEDHGPSGELEEQEKNILHGVLDLHNKRVDDAAVMQTWDNAKAIPLDTVLCEKGLADIMHMNHSRLLVYKPNEDDPEDKRNVVGVVLVKKLIGINPDHEKPVTDIPLRRPLVFQASTDTKPGTCLLEALNEFQKGHSHMGIISHDPEGIRQAWKAGTDTDIPVEALPVGLITMEDIIEEMVNSEVYDETDRQETMILLGRLKVLDKMKGWADQAKRKVATKLKKEHSRRWEDIDTNDSSQLEHSMTEPLLRRDKSERSMTASTPKAGDEPNESQV